MRLNQRSMCSTSSLLSPYGLVGSRFASSRIGVLFRSEVAQAGIAKPVNAVEPAQHVLHQQLALAVWVGRLKLRILQNRRAHRLAVARRRRAEHQAVGPRGQHGLQQRERSRGVVAKIDLRPLHAFARLDQRGKVHHALETPGAECLLQQRTVGQVAFNKLRPRNNRRPPAVTQIVKDGHGMSAGRTQYQYTLEDPDQNELNDWTSRFVAKLNQLPELEDVATDQQTGGLAVSLVIDRVTASRLGIAPTTIDNTLYDAFGQRQINTMYTQLNQYHVILEAQSQFQLDPNKLNHIYVQANAATGTSGAGASTSSGRGSTSAGSNALTVGALYTPAANTLAPATRILTGGNSAGATSGTPSNAIPLSAFSHFETITEPLSITRQGQFPAITVSFNLAPNASLGSAITTVTNLQKGMNMPASLQADFQGTAASFRNSLANEPLLILAALVTVYIVLGVLYESFIHPITILSTLPSAGVGAFLALILFKQ